ncbi:hypothetical protein M0R45_001177 [Rubus argutus]|uniref:Uncharacterized protein n=1 Tax=Rubus argutus TaxID=59490 RepID=A0AAW1VIH6_RUBAR
MKATEEIEMKDVEEIEKKKKKKKKKARGKRKLNRALEYNSEEEGSKFLDMEAQQSHEQQEQEGSMLGKLFTSLRKSVSAVTRKDT